MINVDYTVSGLGDIPLIFTVSIIMNDEFGNFVDGVFAPEGNGTVNLTTDGPGCYSFDIDPFDSSWTFTVSQ